MVLVRIFSLILTVFNITSTPKLIENTAGVEVKEIRAEEKSTAPQKLIIPKINLNADIIAVGLNEDGATEVPSENTKVSWYQMGAKPGEKGSAVLAGHYQWTNGPGVFKRLPELKVGDEIKIMDKQNQEVQFIIRKTEVYDTDLFPLKEVYGIQDGFRLNLVTCFGKYDQKNNDYPQRWVVFAEKSE